MWGVLRIGLLLSTGDGEQCKEAETDDYFCLSQKPF